MWTDKHRNHIDKYMWSILKRKFIWEVNVSKALCWARIIVILSLRCVASALPVSWSQRLKLNLWVFAAFNAGHRLNAITLKGFWTTDPVISTHHYAIQAQHGCRHIYSLPVLGFGHGVVWSMGRGAWREIFQVGLNIPQFMVNSVRVLKFGWKAKVYAPALILNPRSSHFCI